MIRTQIQLPEPLYREIQRIAREQDWSLAEVIRRGAEAVVRTYPSSKMPSPWRPPTPIRATLLMEDPESLRDAARADMERIP